MNVDAPRLLRICRTRADAVSAAIRGAIDQRDKSLPGEFRLLLNRLDGRRAG